MRRTTNGAVNAPVESVLAVPVWFTSQSLPSPEPLFLHSAHPTPVFGVKPVPEMVTLCRVTSPVDGVTVTVGLTSATGASTAAGALVSGAVVSGVDGSGVVVSGVVVSGAVVSGVSAVGVDGSGAGVDGSTVGGAGSAGSVVDGAAGGGASSANAGIVPPTKSATTSIANPAPSL